MPIYEFEGKRPRIAASATIHPTAVIIGDVIIGEKCFILPNAVLRGDAGQIEIGDGTDVQDGSVVHGNCTIGSNTLVGHGVIVHCKRIGSDVMLGMGCIILDNTDIGDGCVVGAGAVVPPGKSIPPGKVLMGVPATVTGDASEKHKHITTLSVQNYQERGQKYATSVREITLDEARART